MTLVTGLVLAAGSGRRMGTPKALLRDPDGTSWLLRSIAAMSRGGCRSVVVVLGAAGEAAARLLEGEDVTAIRAKDWDEGMGASLREGLTHLLGTDTTVALVTLVDLPDVGSDVVARIVARVLIPTPDADDDDAAGNLADVLVRAAYRGVPGHPVAIGRAHWAEVISSAVGDRGARDYLSAHSVALVECADLATGRDVDRPPVPGPTK
jgi:CTP:molybdopterin cytidylyltransferase MocA